MPEVAPPPQQEGGAPRAYGTSSAMIPVTPGLPHILSPRKECTGSPWSEAVLLTPSPGY